MDVATQILRKAIDILFLSHKLRTSLGIALGFVVHGLIKLFTPYLKRLSDIIDITELGWMTCIVFGIIIMQMQTIFFLFQRKSPQNEDIDNILQIIENARKEGLPEWQVRQMYIALYTKMLQNIDFNKETKDQIEKLNKIAPASETGSGPV